MSKFEAGRGVSQTLKGRQCRRRRVVGTMAPALQTSASDGKSRAGLLWMLLISVGESRALDKQVRTNKPFGSATIPRLFIAAAGQIGLSHS